MAVAAMAQGSTSSLYCCVCVIHTLETESHTRSSAKMRYFLVLAAIAFMAVAAMAQEESAEAEYNSVGKGGPMSIEGMAMKMVMSLLQSGSDMLSDTSRVYLIEEDDNCQSPPGRDEMFQKNDAHKIACGDASPGDTVCMCTSMTMMGRFYTKMCGTCDMQLKPIGMDWFVDCYSFMLSYMFSMMGM